MYKYYFEPAEWEFPSFHTHMHNSLNVFAFSCRVCTHTPLWLTIHFCCLSGEC